MAQSTDTHAAIEPLCRSSNPGEGCTITARHLCQIEDDFIWIHFISEVSYLYVEPLIIKDLWNITCVGGDCNGVRVDVSDLEKGDPISSSEFKYLQSILEEMNVVMRADGTALLTWGSRRSFLVDPGRGRITYVEKSNGDSLPRDVTVIVPCSPKL